MPADRPSGGPYWGPTGKSWVSEFRVTDHVRSEVVALRYEFLVEAVEDVTIPAGTFEMFRIRRSRPDDRYVVWYRRELGIEVKGDLERFPTHRLGVGTNELELVSYDIKPK